MENDKTFNRLSGFFEREADAANRIKEKLQESAEAVAGNAGEHLWQGGDTRAREAAVRAFRENQVIFFIAGVSLLGVMIAASFLLGKMSRRRP
jgi:hypothetical protein